MQEIYHPERNYTMTSQEKENKLREVASKHLQDNAITSHCFKAQELEYNILIEAMISFAKSQEVAAYHSKDVDMDSVKDRLERLLDTAHNEHSFDIDVIDAILKLFMPHQNQKTK